MAQTPEYNIKQEMQNLILNYPNRVIRAATDWNVITIGRIQIENLDWRWFENGVQLRSLMMFDPFDWMFRSGIHGDGTGTFKVTKYGLSYREKPLTLASHTPLWNTDAKPEQQAQIMAQEMYRMEKEGARKCENGIEIVPETPLWNTVDSLSTKARNTFRTLLGQKVQELEARHVQYDAEKVWDAGVRVTPEIVAIIRQLQNQMSR